MGFFDRRDFPLFVGRLAHTFESLGDLRPLALNLVRLENLERVRAAHTNVDVVIFVVDHRSAGDLALHSHRIAQLVTAERKQTCQFSRADQLRRELRRNLTKERDFFLSRRNNQDSPAPINGAFIVFFARLRDDCLKKRLGPAVHQGSRLS